MKRYELIAIMVGAPDLTNETELRILSEGGYAAILSANARPVMTMPLTRRAALASAATRQALLERLQGAGTVLVARPHQWVTPEEARDLIRANTQVLHDLGAWLKGKVQFQVSVSWTQGQVLNRFRDTPELAPLFNTSRLSAETLQRAFAQLHHRLAQDIHQLLAPTINSSIALPCTEDMLCNLVVLIDATRETALDHSVERIEAIWPEGFLIRQIGPSPAASFALLDLLWISPENVRAAQNLLGVGSGVTPSDLRQARHAALKNSGTDAGAIQQAARIATAAAGLAPDRGLHLLSVLCEDRGQSDMQPKAVA